MEKIIKKAQEGGYIVDFADSLFPKHGIKFMVLDPLFWQALFRNKTEALTPRQKFFSILFGDEGGEEGWNVAIDWLTSLIEK